MEAFKMFNNGVSYLFSKDITIKRKRNIDIKKDLLHRKNIMKKHTLLRAIERINRIKSDLK
jgi:hypothetical protein